MQIRKEKRMNGLEGLDEPLFDVVQHFKEKDMEMIQVKRWMMMTILIRHIIRTSMIKRS